MLTFRLHNVRTYVRDATPEEIDVIDSFLSLPDRTAYFRGRPGERIRLFDRTTRSFPSGLLPSVRAQLDTSSVEDVREPTPPPDVARLLEFSEILMPHQRAILEAQLESPRGILKASTGCHARGQGILMHDGSIRAVETISIGDRLMGPDSSPRRVKRLIHGNGQLMKIIPLRGDPFVVNMDHVLTLVRTNEGARHRDRGGELVDVTVQEWIGWSKHQKHLHKLIRTGVDFPPGGLLPIPPYFLGVSLGDGSINHGVIVHKPDLEIGEACRDIAALFDLTVTMIPRGGRPHRWAVVKPACKGVEKANPLMTAFAQLGLRGTYAGTKFIPVAYKTASRHDRLELLAGLLDTDGHNNKNINFDYISKSRQLTEDVAYVARSLGFYCCVRACEKRSQLGSGGTYYRLTISGHLNEIPTRIARKQVRVPRKMKKVSSRSGFSVQPIGEGEFFGFMLDSDGRYLLEDFTITHNSGKGSSLCAAMWCWSTVRWLVVCHSRDIINELAIRYERLTGERPGVLGGGRNESDRRITFTTFAFLYSNRKKRACAAFLEAQHGLMLDEAHGASAPSCATVTEGARNAYLRYAWSATPLDRTDARSALVIGATGPLLTNIKIPELVAADVIAKPTSLWVRHDSNMKLLGEAQPDPQMSLTPPSDDFLDEYTEEPDGFAEFYTRAIVQNGPRNDRILAIVEWIRQHDGFPLVLFIQRIEHGMALRDALRLRGFRTEFAWGKVKNKQRAALLHDLAGELQILVANKVLQAGVDQEAIRTVFNAGAGASSIMTLQQAGRAMRIGRRHALGKTTCRIVDFEDAGHEWLERHAKARQRACRRAGIEIQYIPESELYH